MLTPSARSCSCSPPRGAVACHAYFCFLKFWLATVLFIIIVEYSTLRRYLSGCVFPRDGRLSSLFIMGDHRLPWGLHRVSVALAGRSRSRSCCGAWIRLGRCAVPACSCPPSLRHGCGAAPGLIRSFFLVVFCFGCWVDGPRALAGQCRHRAFDSLVSICKYP